MDACWQLELHALLELLASSPSPVGSAVRWVESHGRTGVGSNHSGIGSLWRFVPDVLAKEVVFLEEPLEPVSGGTVGNCLWLQTLPLVLQANILTFLATEHVRFRAMDLKALARRLLSSGELDYWVRQAAQLLLTTTSAAAELELEHHESLPIWLSQSVAGEGSMLVWLPVRPSTLESGEQDATVVGRRTSQDDHPGSAESTAKRRKVRRQGSNVAASGEEHEQPHAKQPQSSESTSPENDVARSPNQAEILQKGSQDINEEILGSGIFHRAMLLRERALSNRLAAGQIQEEVELFRVAPDLNILLGVLRPWEFDDDVTLGLVGSLLGDQEGYAWSAQMMSSLLLQKLQALKQPASRIMLMAVVRAAKAQPRASVDSIILPLLYADEGASPLQCEVINRVVKDCLTVSSVSLLLQKVLSPESGKHWGVSILQPESSSRSLVWTESMVGVLQNLLNFRGLSLEEDTAGALVLSLQGVTDQFAGSLKFANLLLSLVTKHSAQLKPMHVRLLHQIAERTTTFLSKSLVAKLSKL